MPREQYTPPALSDSLPLPQVIRWLSMQVPLFAKIATAPLKVRTVTTAATTFDVQSDDVILVDTTGGSVTVTLPPPSKFATRGRPGYCKKLVAANTMTIDPAVNIDGAASVAVTTQWQTVGFVSDGSAYYTI